MRTTSVRPIVYNLEMKMRKEKYTRNNRSDHDFESGLEIFLNIFIILNYTRSLSVQPDLYAFVFIMGSFINSPIYWK